MKHDGFLRWHPPLHPPPCQSPEKHGGIRDGGWCDQVWQLCEVLRPREDRITLDETYKLLRALHDQSHICDTMRCWRNQLIGEVAVLLQKSLGRMPFVPKPEDAILQLHVGRGAKGNLKDVDEGLGDNMEPTSEHLSLNSKLGKKFPNDLNVNLEAHTYPIETCNQFEGGRKFSISFDEAELGREKDIDGDLVVA